jgi:hypothetical protein
MKPNLMQLWNAFPDHTQYPTLRELYTWLGGHAAQNINAPGFGPNGNTCASRLSVAFNKGGSPISAAIAGAVGAATVTAADGTKIIFRVTEFRKYLLHILGNPTIDDTSPYNDVFLGRRGIIAFTVNWSDASGHIALWNGNAFREPAHDDFSAYVNAENPNVKTSRGEFWAML